MGGERGGGRDEEEDAVTSWQGWSLDKMWGEESGEAKKGDVVSDAQQLSALEMTHEQTYNASAAAASGEGHWSKAFDPESGLIHTHTCTRTHMYMHILTHTCSRTHIHTYTNTHIHTNTHTHQTKLN